MAAAPDSPQAVKDGITFWPIPETTLLDEAFGLQEDAYFDRRQLPYVPQEYVRIVSRLFYEGGSLPELSPSVDLAKAKARMRAILCSFAPPHESKEATAAYALWVWSTPSITSGAPA